jgi:phage terminase large subunit GpA-like protein
MSTSISPSSENRAPLSPADRLLRAWRKGIAPAPRISVPDWADAYRILAKSAGSISGPWRTSRVEIARGPMLAATEPGVHVLTAMVSTQLLKTSLLENIFGHAAHLDPCPMLVVQPKDDAAEQFSKERIGPMVEATPVLRDLVGTAKTRNAKETLHYKAFPGGFLALVGAGSPDNLARRPVRIVMYDEVDKYPVTREGDPLDLGDERMATFVDWLSVRACSPTVEDESRIDTSYQASDQRRASVACPHCAHRQFLDFFKHVEWTRIGPVHDTDSAAIYCEACQARWSEGERLRALASIRWHQSRPFTCCAIRQIPLEAYEGAWRVDGLADPVEAVWDWWSGDRWAVYRCKCRECGAWPVANRHAGFQAGKLYSPWPKDSPAEQAAKWIAAQGDEDKKQTWWNTQQGLPYKRHTGKALAVDALAARAEVWSAEVPDGAAVLTVGVDVQDYRLEIETVGWGVNEESWSVDYHVIDGEMDDPRCADRLDDYLKRRFRGGDGRELVVMAACIDSGGHHTQSVYEFCKARLGRRVWAIKGESARGGQRNPVWPVKRPTSRTKKSFRPIILGVNAAKDAIRDRLLKTEPGPGYMHFPADRDLGYYAQLTAERLVVKEAPGRKYRVWELPSGRANEALDCRVYAYGALCGLLHMGLKLNRRAAGEEVVAVPASPPAAMPPPAQPIAERAVTGPPKPAPPPGPRKSQARPLASRLAGYRGPQ